MLPLIALSALAACAGQPGDDRAQVNAALLRVMTTPGRAICVDSRTHGEPLTAFRSMLRAPDPARRPLVWRSPVPLDPDRVLSGRDLIDTEFRNDQSLLSRRDGGGALLSLVAQTQLNAIAAEASNMGSDGGGVADDPANPLARVRWWVRNRLDSTCDTPYTVSRMVILHSKALVSISAGHRGTTYAFVKTVNGWKPVAKWADWLF